MLSETILPFGKYKGQELSKMLRDRQYCKWALEQDWFSSQYEFLYNRVLEYDPKQYFLDPSKKLKIAVGSTPEYFLENYSYFYLNKNPIILTEPLDKVCYDYYLKMIDELKEKLTPVKEEENKPCPLCGHIANPTPKKKKTTANPFDIKAPTNWLQNFEKTCQINREVFKEFLNAYELPNIPYIIEDIKAVGGIEYKGAKSFLIAKENSLKQEQYWGELLKSKYGEDIGVQFKFESNQSNCIFDYVCIKNKVIYECKIGLKDFDESQYIKYSTVVRDPLYTLVYLISTDCVIDMKKKILYTNCIEKYIDFDGFSDSGGVMPTGFRVVEKEDLREVI